MVGWQSRCSTTAVYDRHVILNFIAIITCTTGVRFWATCYNSEERFAVFFNLKTTFFYCCNQTTIDGWEGQGGLCNPLAQGATARAKFKRRRNTPITRLSSISRITDRRLTHGRHAQWLGQSRTSFSHVLSQNETWWSPAWFPLEQQR